VGDKIEKNVIDEACSACGGRKRRGENEGKRTLGRPRRTWLDNIQVALL
jgi:hypothetical protein